MRPGGSDRLDPTDASGDVRQPCPDGPSNSPALSSLGVRSVPRGSLAVAAALFLALLSTAGRYGYHRDELYFIVAGRHPAFGYPDQPPLVPLLAAGWDAVTGGQLWAFRLLPALVAALVVVVASITCAQLGGTPAHQVGAALITGLSTFAVAMGHLFSTSTFTLLLTALTVLLLIRALERDDLRSWLLTGASAGIAMQVQTLPAFTLASCLAGLLIAGPRASLVRPWPYLAAAVEAVLAAPYLIWQAAHGWPQLDVARDIAAGGSTSSVDRWQVIPFQLLMVGPLISVVLVAGVAVLLRSPAFRSARWLGVAYLVLLVLITATGGKPYYATGLIPAVLAPGVIITMRWIGDSRARRRLAGVVLVAHAIPTAFLCLPLAPAGSPIFEVANAVNPDTGETVGWDRLVAQTAGVASRLPACTVVLAQNYGEAGALDRARRDGVALPRVYSGHNAYGAWGPPPAGAATVLVVGYYPGELASPGTGPWFGSCRQAAVIDTGVDDDEDGAPIMVCTGPTRPWAQLWPHIRRLS